VFYELLAGTSPIDFKKAGLHEFLKKLREEEPAKPSASIRTRAEGARTELARTHRTTAPALLHELRGDLDAITLKALAKDRSHRYSTPSDFAADIRHFLNQEPVLAVPPSATYRWRKFARRYRVAIATAAAFVIVLVAATAISVRQSIRANRESATARAISDFLQNDLILQASAQYQGGRPDPDLKVRTLLDRAAAHVSEKFKGQPENEASLRMTIARAYNGVGDVQHARSNMERSVELFRSTLGPDHPKTFESENMLAFTMINQGDFEKAEAILGPAFIREQRVLGRQHRTTLAAMEYLSNLKKYTGSIDEAAALKKELIEIGKRVDGSEAANTLMSMSSYATILYGQGKYTEAEAQLREVLEIERRGSGTSSLVALRARSLLAQALNAEHRFQEAEAMLNDLIEDQLRAFGPEHPSRLASMTALAEVYAGAKRYAEAEALHLKILEIKRRVLGLKSRNTLGSLTYLYLLYEHQGKYSQAEPYAAEALAGARLAGSENSVTMDTAADLADILIQEKKFSAAEPLSRESNVWYQKNRPDSWQTFRSRTLVGASLAGAKKFAEAEPMLLQGYEGMTARKQKMSPDDFADIDHAAAWLVNLYEAWGKPDQAAKWRGIPSIAN
jgi:hypothetical protein